MTTLMPFRVRQLVFVVSLAAMAVSAGWLCARWSAGQESPPGKSKKGAAQSKKEVAQPKKEAAQPKKEEAAPPNKEAAPKDAEPAKEAAPAGGTEEDKNRPLYQQQPHEELHLRDGRDRDGKEKVAIVKVRPLDLPNDELPKSILIEIQVRLVDRDETYRLVRGKILQRLRFRDLILREAERLVEAGKTDPKKFDEAFYYYQHLRANYNKDQLPTLAASTARFHLEEAKSYVPKRRYAQALALLNLAFELHPETPGLADAMAEAIQGLIDGYLSQKKFASARALLAAFQQKFPQHASAAKWQEQLSGEAQKLLDQAKAQLDGQDLNEARELALRSVNIWPLDAARKLLDEAQRLAPRIVVGVTQPARRFDPELLDDWAARRGGRLLHRLLLEFTGHGALGGQYRCPLGPDPRHEALGRQLVLHQGLRASRAHRRWILRVALP